MGKSLLVKLGSVVLAIIVAVGIFFIKNKGEEKIEQAKAPKVGECINVKGSFNAKHTELKCSGATATYKVAGDDGKCDGNETTYKISLGTGKSGNVADLCLGLNAKVGDCFEFSATSEEKVECTKTGSSIVKVASVGKSGEQCASPAQPVDYPKRGTLLCFVPNAA